MTEQQAEKRKHGPKPEALRALVDKWRQDGGSRKDSTNPMLRAICQTMFHCADELSAFLQSTEAQPVETTACQSKPPHNELCQGARDLETCDRCGGQFCYCCIQQHSCAPSVSPAAPPSAQDDEVDTLGHRWFWAVCGNCMCHMNSVGATLRCVHPPSAQEPTR